MSEDSAAPKCVLCGNILKDALDKRIPSVCCDSDDGELLVCPLAWVKFPIDSAKALSAKLGRQDITGKQLARKLFATGDEIDIHGGKCQRIEFKGGTWPDNETALGGFDEIALATFFDAALRGEPK